MWRSENPLRGTVGKDGDILFSRSVNSGQTWSRVGIVNDNAATDLGSDEFPRIASDGYGTWVVVWNSNNTLDGKGFGDDHVFYSRSTDNGTTWSPVAEIDANAATDPGYDIQPAIATDGFGNWVVAWTSGNDLGGTIGGEGDILFSCSTDNGITWPEVDALNANADSDLPGDFSVRVVTDGMGHWTAAWISEGVTTGTDNDLLVASAGLEDLRVLAPEGGERWRTGGTKRIRWITSAGAGDRVRIELLRGDEIERTLRESAPNDGKYKWTIPDDIVPGEDYRARVISTVNSEINDTSDQAFEVTIAG